MQSHTVGNPVTNLHDECADIRIYYLLNQDKSRIDILSEYQKNTFYGNQFFFHMERGRVKDPETHAYPHSLF